jgi:hypothetical protein
MYITRQEISAVLVSNENIVRGHLASNVDDAKCVRAEVDA